MQRTLALLAAVFVVAPSASAQPVFPQAISPVHEAARYLIDVHDLNGDRRLNADECPPLIRGEFALIDVDHDGFVTADELVVVLARKPPTRGRSVANRVVTVADDFVVEVYHNGKAVPLASRALLNEVHGATVERLDIDVREGDWLVFHVVNNGVRWDGVRYFAVAGRGPEGAGFDSNPTTGGWLACDDPAQAAAFIANREAGTKPISMIEKKWDAGDSLMAEHVPDWRGTPVWGRERSTWIKYVAPSGRDMTKATVLPSQKPIGANRATIKP